MPLRNVGAITLFGEDVHRSKRFNDDVFDVKLVDGHDHSAAYDFGNAIVNLLELPEARDLEPSTVAGREAGSRFQLTIRVSDAVAVCADLATAGVPFLNGPVNREWVMRIVAFTDPDGNVWEVAQALSAEDR